MKRRLKKVGGALVGFDDEAVEALKRLPADTLLYYDITNPRNGKFHKKFFAMLNVIVQNYVDDITVEQLLTYIKDQLNMWDVVIIGNMHQKRYKSISFKEMEEDSFADFYSRAIDVCLELIPLKNEELAIQVANF